MQAFALRALALVAACLLLTNEIGAQDQPRTDAPKATRVDRHGDPLPDGVLLRLGTSRFRHAGEIYSLAVSDDGKLIVTGNAGYKGLLDDASVVVWDAQTGKRIRTWTGHAHVVRSVAISPDNKLVAVANGYGKLHVFDVATGAEPRRYDVESSGRVAFTRDGKALLAVDVRRVRRWDLATGKELEQLAGSAEPYANLMLAADGKTIGYTSGGVVHLFDAAGRKRGQFQVTTKSMYGASLSPDGTRLACRTSEPFLEMWDTTTGRRLWSVRESDMNVGPQSFSPDGKTLVTGGAGIKLWDVATGKVLHSIAGPYGFGRQVAFSGDGKRLVSADGAAEVYLRDPATGTEITRFPGHRHAVVAGAFAPDGQSLATVADERFVFFWDLKTAKYRRVASSETLVTSLAFAPNRKTLLTVAERAWPVEWDLATGKEVRKFKSTDDLSWSNEPDCRKLALSADGAVLAANTGFVGIRFWDTATGQERPVMFLGELGLTNSFQNFVHFALAPDGQSVATTISQTGHSGVVRWDLATGEKRPTKKEKVTPQAFLLRDGSIHAKRTKLAQVGWPAAYSPDGRLVAILSSGEVWLVEAATGLSLRRLKADAKYVTCAAFSPDGWTLATSGDDKDVHLWECATGQRRDRLVGHQARTNFVAFAPEGRRLASGGGDHTVLIWDLPRASGKRDRLTAQDLDACWTALAGSDAAEAYRAIWKLVADAEQGVAYLKERLKPAAAVDPKTLARLLADLDSERFATRQQANQELEKLADQAVPALRDALKGQVSLEFRRRVEALLAAVTFQPPRPEQLRHLRAIELLGQIATPGACQILQALADGPPAARVSQEAKARLARLTR